MNLLFWKRRKLWVPKHKKYYKTADPPHDVTLSFTVISAVASFLALCMNFTVLHNASKSFEIGQRAYVSIADGKLRVVDYGSFFDVNKSNSSKVAVRLTWSAMVRNDGNTPAVFYDFRPTYKLPPGWKIADVSQGLHKSYSYPYEIAPRTAIPWQYEELIEVPPDDYHKFIDAAQTVFIYANGALGYRDVFGMSRETRWCWVTAANSRHLEMTTCQNISSLIHP